MPNWPLQAAGQAPTVRHLQRKEDSDRLGDGCVPGLVLAARTTAMTSA